MRPGLKLFFAMTLLFNLSCSVNILENFSDKTTNDALYVDANRLVSSGNYAAALAKIANMTPEFAAGRNVQFLKAKAHAGVCGLNFFDFVLAMRNLGTQKILPFLLGHFRGGGDTTKMDQCRVAEDLLESFGMVGVRTLDENLLLLLVSFTKIGTTLSYYADADQDGTATAAYDVCAIGGAGVRTAGGAMPDEDAREVGTGLTLAKETLSAIGGQIDLGSGSLSSFDTVCADMTALNPAIDFCEKTDPADFTATELLAIRSLAREGSAVGLDLNGCAGGDITSGACRCF